jgi:predicted Zn-dependent protease
LIAQAAHDYPETADWSWQLHTSTDPEQDADCMAGGQILVGQPYAERLALNDAELAMLLAHEIAHAALRHNLQEYELALRLEPARAALPFAELWQAVDHDRALMDKLAPLGREQEAEADRAGMRLAIAAGWPPERLANYYQKLLRASSKPGLDSDTHPSPLSRWRAAQAQATGPQH